MNTPPSLPEPDSGQRLLWSAYQENRRLRQDLDVTRQDLAQARDRIDQLRQSLGQATAELEKLRQEHAAKLEELARLKHKRFGRSSERAAEDPPVPPEPSDPLQPPHASAGSADEAAEPSEKTAEPRRRQRRKKRLDLTHLPHVRHLEDLPEAEKVCPCCQRTKDKIGEDVTRVLEFVPAKLEVHEHVRPKYACRHCKDGVSTSTALVRPIPRCLAGPGLLAQVLVAKYGDHLPLYRQEDVFVRHGLHLPRSTMCDWVAAAAQVLQPLYQRQRERLLLSEVLWTDDTPVTVLGGKAGGSRQGRFWTYLGDPTQPYTVYDFTLSRSRDGPQQFLKGFKGYLHADAYAGYDAIYLGSDSQVREVACWAHARRKFFEAKDHAPREAGQVLGWIGQLYDLEDRARDSTAEERRQLRQREAVPVLDRIGAYLQELARTALPKSGLAKAVTYARNQWEALRRYTTDGRLTIDNNASERTLRTQAIGRNNWMFVGSSEGGERAAVVYTLLAGAKRHQVEPLAYLRDVLRQAAEEKPNWEEMLPDRWAKQHPEAILTHRLEETRQRAQRQQARRKRRRMESIPG